MEDMTTEEKERFAMAAREAIRAVPRYNQEANAKMKQEFMAACDAIPGTDAIQAKLAAEQAVYSGGAKRSRIELFFSLIPKSAIVALARRLTYGAKKYEPNNWRTADGEDFRRATIDHLFNHLLDYMESGNTKDNNTDAIICNAAFLCEYESRTPYYGNLMAENNLRQKRQEVENAGTIHRQITLDK
jgi:hypothetical protein